MHKEEHHHENRHRQPQTSQRDIGADTTFLGIDHGTTAIRFANAEDQCFEIQRQEAGRLSPEEISKRIEKNFSSEIDLIALCYSMGDGLTKIVRLGDAINRGVRQLDGAGVHIGGGTNVFEAIKSSGWPAILLPGIHRESDIDPRFKVFSHGMSPEKVGLAYSILKLGVNNFIVSDASSNTVTFGVFKGKIIGAIDAPIFAPGLIQGPLDVEAIRMVDSGRMTANQAFSKGGILAKLGKKSLDECDEDLRKYALESLALFAAMEISAMIVLLRDLGEPYPELYLAGSPAQEMNARVSELLGREVVPMSRCASAKGCAMVAEEVFLGSTAILGIEVDERARHKLGQKR